MNDGSDGRVLGNVTPGQTTGDSFLLVRSLGLGDSGVYDDNAQAEVARRCLKAGIDFDGTVTPKIWGLILRTVRYGDSGKETSRLRELLGLSKEGTFDQDVLDALSADEFDGDDWMNKKRTRTHRNAIPKSQKGKPC